MKVKGGGGQLGKDSAKKGQTQNSEIPEGANLWGEYKEEKTNSRGESKYEGISSAWRPKGKQDENLKERGEELGRNLNFLLPVSRKG